MLHRRYLRSEKTNHTPQQAIEYAQRLRHKQSLVREYGPEEENVPSWKQLQVSAAPAQTLIPIKHGATSPGQPKINLHNRRATYVHKDSGRQQAKSKVQTTCSLQAGNRGAEDKETSREKRGRTTTSSQVSFGYPHERGIKDIFWVTKRAGNLVRFLSFPVSDYCVRCSRLCFV